MVTTKVVVESVATSIASLKVAETAAPRATPVAPLDGKLAVTVGGVVSGGPEPAPVKTTSTQ